MPTANALTAIRRSSALLALLLTLAACAVRLAPLYDQALVQGITAANADTLELLASASGGTQKTRFDEREPRYYNLIGRLDALAIQAGTRPPPKASAADAAVPSQTALQAIADSLRKMSDTDREQGLTEVEVQAFRGQILIYMDQALTYEAALERY